jgi:uncharacterized membrane protein
MMSGNMASALSSSKSDAEALVASPFYGERFTQRLEAFSDLVFGFSLSLLATRLDIPANASQVFETTRWTTFIITFGTICAIWLSHYRIFRHHFVAQTADVIVNFIFLLGIAVLPYVVQTFLRFSTSGNAVILYLGDFAFILTALATLRWRALRQRRDDPDTQIRLREWRGTVRQYILVAVIIAFLFAMNAQLIPAEKFLSFGPAAALVVTLGARLSVRRLPRFLDATRS